MPHWNRSGTLASGSRRLKEAAEKVRKRQIEPPINADERR
jgi:hypothetical protein